MTPPPTDHSTVTLWLLGVLAGVVVFLFGKLYSQITNATKECQKDRDILRVKIDDQSEKVNDLLVRTAVAERMLKIPCHHDDCPKLTDLIKAKQPKVIEE